MARPLMQHGVGQLEEMFAKGKADPKVLKQLENELQYRQVPRAVALLADVQAAMYVGAAAAKVPTVPTPRPAIAPATAPVSQQPDLWEHPDPPPAVPQPASVCTAAPAERPLQSPPVTKAPETPPAMPLEDAYRVLKATPAATWESLEQTRRTLVQKSHPSRWKTLSAEKRVQALSEAERVNAAYAAVAQDRCGGR